MTDGPQSFQGRIFLLYTVLGASGGNITLDLFSAIRMKPPATGRLPNWLPRSEPRACWVRGRLGPLGAPTAPGRLPSLQFRLSANTQPLVRLVYNRTCCVLSQSRYGNQLDGGSTFPTTATPSTWILPTVCGAIFRDYRLPFTDSATSLIRTRWAKSGPSVQ